MTMSIHDGSVNDSLLDLLVDGELDESRRRELLEQLEQSPDGWRRCALAFLEAQSWRREMPSLLPASVPTVAPPQRPRTPKRRAWRSLTAVAVGFLLSFVAGMAAEAVMRPNPVLVENTPPKPAAPQTKDAASPSVQDNSLAMSQSDASESVIEPAEPFVPLDEITLQVREGPDSPPREVRLPVVDAEVVSEEWLQGGPRAVPSELVELFRQLGHDVTQQRQLVSFALNDGRRVLVPIDAVEVRPMDPRSFY